MASSPLKARKKTETEDKDRLFSERYYIRFERRIPVEDVEEDKVSASFRNGVLTVTLPKTEAYRNQGHVTRLLSARNVGARSTANKERTG